MLTYALTYAAGGDCGAVGALYDVPQALPSRSVGSTKKLKKYKNKIK